MAAFKTFVASGGVSQESRKVEPQMGGRKSEDEVLGPGGNGGSSSCAKGGSAEKLLRRYHRVVGKGVLVLVNVGVIVNVGVGDELGAPI